MKNKLYKIVYLDDNNNIVEAQIKGSMLSHTIVDMENSNFTLISITLQIG